MNYFNRDFSLLRNYFEVCVILPMSANNFLLLSRTHLTASTTISSIGRAERGKDYTYPETYLLIVAVLVYGQSKVIFLARRGLDMKKVRNYGPAKHICHQRLDA